MNIQAQTDMDKYHASFHRSLDEIYVIGNAVNGTCIVSARCQTPSPYHEEECESSLILKQISILKRVVRALYDY